ncbi:type II secretion system GspH family protein [Cohnella rhizosphaerae]|uniref:Type II secretion system GspH family protein n=1 Tax=Cohnella rhizosphaerae TaxID=1457232 RepID=A0A9X4QXH4_9BACL|nr:type II secretion system protein [Cohnella rhizosphaerae]MDG0814588.1 type II secretion system GspH family protein [Cohnella rhizosphaerae]
MRTWLRKRQSAEEGFSLIEVLAAITILSIVSLAMTAFFIQAMSYAKGNQNKTVAVNLARNALFFVEKQSFDVFKNYFEKSGSSIVDPSSCEYDEANNIVISCKDASATADLFNDVPNLWVLLNPSVNGRDYQLTIEYDDKLLAENDKAEGLENYLIPIKVVTREKNANPGSRGSAEVGGYITDEKIR